MNGQRPQVVLALESTDARRRHAALELAARLNLALAEDAHAQAPFVLAVRDAHLELRDSTMKPGRGVCADLGAFAPAGARRPGAQSRRQPIARAVGAAARTVIDATAGLGQDSALLAALGHAVIAVERSPIIGALLMDGLRRAQAGGAAARIQVVVGDARQLLQDRSFNADAVYVDPMFPPKRKAAALANKRVRLLREIVGTDEDAAELVGIARQRAPRVVVKRPTYAQPLAPDPAASFGGKLVRYDVYVQAPDR